MIEKRNIEVTFKFNEEKNEATMSFGGYQRKWSQTYELGKIGDVDEEYKPVRDYWIEKQVK